MNVGMGPDAGEQRFVPAFQKLGQKSFPVAEVIDKAPCIGAGPQGQAANGKGAQPGFPDNHGTRIEQVPLVDFRLGMKVKLEPPCVPLYRPARQGLVMSVAVKAEPGLILSPVPPPES